MIPDAAAPDRYALIGHPVGHSRSPFIHGMFAAATSQNMRYQLIDVAPERAAEKIHEFFASGGKGLNVTVPHKELAADTVHSLTARAAEAHAVNTIYRDADGTLSGDNTDGIGLVRDLTQNLGIPLEGRRILILGAGGATRGVLGPLFESRPESLHIANRTIERAADLAARFLKRGFIQVSGFEDLPAHHFDLVINATSAGLNGDMPQVSPTAIGAETICYDMSYGSGGTPFTHWARSRGAAMCYQGLGMLVEQAAESFFIWRGVRPETAPVLTALRSHTGT
jgi:shikimate dehydrogenase